MRHRGRRLHDDPHARRQGHDHRLARGVARRRCSPDSFFDENGTALAFEPARWSGLSAGVPGTVAGWERALRRYGTQSLARTLRPGIEVAREGFTVDQTFVDQTTPALDYFDDIPSTAELYLDEDGTAPDVGDTIRNRDLARTYRMIAREGPRAFYRGELAEAIVDAVTNPPVGPGANHTWRQGLMTEQDLRNYEALRREPTHMTYRGLDVWGMGPPSSGGSTVGETLNILEGYSDLAKDRTRALHLFLESSRFAFADRNAYVADPDFFDVPLAGLLSDGFAGERRALIDEAKAATSPVPPGNPYDDEGSPGRAEATVSHPRQSTTHLVVSDRHGTVVSYTFTIESTGGNGIVVPGYGFLLNNELTDFNFDSQTPSEPRRRQEAPAQLDEPDDRDPPRRAHPRRRLAGRLDDHPDGRSGAARAARPRAPRCRRRSRGRAPLSATR